MTHEDRQAQLLDEYLTALQRDPQAAAPDSLEPDMAEFARMMVAPSPASTTDDTTQAQERIWQDIAPTPSALPLSDYKVESDPYMENLKKKRNRPISSTQGWLPLVATAVIAVILSVGVMRVFFDGGQNVPPPAAQPNDEFTNEEMQATIDALSTEINQQNQIASSTPIPTATATFTPTPVPTSRAQPTQMLATALPPAGGSTSPLVCDFETDLYLNLNQSTVTADQQLIVSVIARHPNTEHMIIEIFGGTITDDAYLPITTIDNPQLGEMNSTMISGDMYERGFYLLQVRLLDANDETLASCGLPVSFTD